MIDTKVEAARATGGAALLGWWGMTLNEWVAVATLIYFMLQIVILTPKAAKVIRSWRR